MKRHCSMLAAAALTVTFATGCQTNEQTGMLMGGGLGVLGGGLIGQALGGQSGALIGAALGGLGGAFAGSAIGRDLDARDRQRAEEATRMALAAPPAAQPQPVNWVSDQNTGTKGRAQVVAVQKQSAGGECRTVRETAYIKGEERVQNARYCQNADGEWIARA